MNGSDKRIRNMEMTILKKIQLKLFYSFSRWIQAEPRIRRR